MCNLYANRNIESAIDDLKAGTGMRTSRAKRETRFDASVEDRSEPGLFQSVGR